MAVKGTKLDGDFSVGRNASIGGKAVIAGCVVIGHDLRIEGWLDAPNIKGPLKGLFESEQELIQSYPFPRNGWYALVGDSLPAKLYMAKKGRWVDTRKTSGDINIDLTAYNEAKEYVEILKKNNTEDVKFVRVEGGVQLHDAEHGGVMPVETTDKMVVVGSGNLEGKIQSLDNDIAGKQPMLRSGENISTINGQDLTKGGDIKIKNEVEFNKPMPTVTIDCVWTFFDDNEHPVSASNISPRPDANNPVLENGYRAKFNGTYKWTGTEHTKEPTRVSSMSQWKDLPYNGEDSSLLISRLFSTDTTILAKVYAPRTGLITNGISVVPATGEDSAEARRTVSFRHRLYYGVLPTSNVTEMNVKALGKSQLVSGKGTTVDGVTTDSEEYFLYAYPSALGDLTSIIQNGATPVLGAFTKKIISLTNIAGKTISYNVYVSNNKGAFTNVSLKFS